MRKLSIAITMFIFALFSTLSATAFANGPKDGELKFPENYEDFPRFLSGIQKPKHVRDLFINPTGNTARVGELLPNGSVLVMEIYNAKLDTEGNAIKRPDGKNAKDNLAKIYVMEKGKGWGKNAPAGLKTGDWIFSAFSPEGQPLKVDFTKCRSCHLPLNNKDFVHRYNEFFNKRANRN